VGGQGEIANLSSNETDDEIVIVLERRHIYAARSLAVGGMRMKLIRSITITITLAVALALALGVVPAAQAAQARNLFPSGRYMMMDGFGYWEFTFQPDGAFTVNLNGIFDVVQHGRYTVHGDHVTFSDDSEVCEGKGDGQYAWRMDGDMLAMRTISDRCTLWRFALTKGLTPINAQTMRQWLPAGIYSAQVARKDAPRFPQLVGEWTWRIGADGWFTLALNGNLVQQGWHVVLGDKVRFVANAETFPCFMPNSRDPLQQPDTFKPGVMKSAVYRWKVDRGAPSLEHFYDWCHARRFLWMNASWVKVSASHNADSA
jgi:hypothetical protein